MSDLETQARTNMSKHADDVMLNFKPLLNATNAELSSHKMRNDVLSGTRYFIYFEQFQVIKDKS